MVNRTPELPNLMIALLLAALASAQVMAAEEAQAEQEASGSRVYRTTDAEGNTVFSDVRSEGATEVELGETIFYPSEAIRQPDRPIDPRAVGSDQAPASTYRALSILEPAADEVIRNNTGSFVVKGALAPGLAKDHRIQLLIDGEVYASGQSLLFELENVDRGVHELQLQIVDDLTQKVLASSTTVRMSLMRFSALHPGGRANH